MCEAITFSKKTIANLHKITMEKRLGNAIIQYNKNLKAWSEF